jgi:hypothetical protein
VLYARHACWQTLGRRIAEELLLERETRAHELLTYPPNCCCRCQGCNAKQ